MMSSALPVEGEDKLKETGDPIWIGFLRRESSILQRRKEVRIQTINRRRNYNQGLRELVNAA